MSEWNGNAEAFRAYFHGKLDKNGDSVARGDIWNGVPGSGVTHAICDGCASVDDALQALEELAEKHPNTGTIP